MPVPASPLAQQAEAILKKQLTLLREPNKYISLFQTGSGRHMALERQRKNDIYVWAEVFSDSMEGIEIKNQKVPGQPYSAEQPRNSNVTPASARLGVARRAYYLKCDTPSALERLVHWYSVQ